MALTPGLGGTLVLLALLQMPLASVAGDFWSFVKEPYSRWESRKVARRADSEAAERERVRNAELTQRQFERQQRYERAHLLRSIRQREATARRALRLIPTTKAPPTWRKKSYQAYRTIEEHKRILRGLAARAAGTSIDTPLGDMQKLAEELDYALRRGSNVVDEVPANRNEPPAWLYDAGASYFAGDYERTITLLGLVSFPDSRAKTQACLFRSAAQYALWVHGGETDQLKLNAAIEQVRECRRLQPGITPDDGAFSPRFVAFFKGIRG